jgi:hypothetical protein
MVENQHENYETGINKLVELESIHIYPLKFYMLWTDFKQYTVKDSVSLFYLLTILMTGDWFFELEDRENA